jgi:phage baseplate assembly protein V
LRADDLHRFLAPLTNRLRGMVARGIVRMVDDARLAQEVQLDLLAGETMSGAEHFQHYGFSSVPHGGAEAVVVFVGGTRSHGVVVATADRRFRIKNMQGGEVALHDDLGNVVKLGRDALTISAVSKVSVSAPIAEIISDDLRLGGSGGARVARVGDDVNLTTGKIVSGSAKVTAA